MDEIFSYWPLLFFVLAIISRIMRSVNKRQNNVIKKSEVDTKPTKEQQNQSENFSFDKEDSMDYQNKEYKASNEKVSKKDKKRIKKIKIKKVKKKDNHILRNKDDLIRGIIIKEVLDKPKFME